jgi:hypothetical protein
MRARRPFTGTWTRPGQSRPAGRLLCEYGDGVATLDWTETGRPILGRLLYSADDRQTAVQGADLAWQQVRR